MQRGTVVRKGFTLIELLVVVSIIALLIAILLPVLGKVQSNVVLTQCRSNLHQAGIAVHGYHADHQRLPPIYRRHLDPPDENPVTRVTLYRAASQGYDFRAYVDDYINRDLRAWDCPNVSPLMTSETYNATPSQNYFYGSYAYYPGRRNLDFGTGQRAPERLSKVRGRHPMMQDQVRDQTAVDNGILTNHKREASAQTMGQVDGANILYYDGSAEWAPSADLVDVGYSLSRIWSVKAQ